MATIIAAAGGGNWTTGATWVGGVAPTAADDAQLTVASGNVTINSGAVARSLDCTTYVGTLTHSAAVTLTLGDGTAGAGNVALKLVAGMTYTLGSASTSAISYISTSATQQTITAAGKTFGNMTISGAGSSYLLSDAVAHGTAATVSLTAGTFDTGNQACTWGLFSSSGSTARTLTLGSSAVAVAGSSISAFQHTGSNLTVTANTAVITSSGSSAGVTMTSVSMNGASLVFTAAAMTARVLNTTVNNCTYNGPTAIGATFQHTGLTVTGTLTITSNSVVNRVMVIANTFATQATLTAAAVSFTNVDFQDTDAAGAAIPWTGTSMGDALGNANITFDTPVTQTRTGAGGNWSTVGNWTSRAPLPQDDVVVGAGASGTITRDVTRLGKSIDFTGFAGTFATGAPALASFGSLTISAGMAISGSGVWTLWGRGTHTITSNGKTFTQALTISAPGGSYTLADTLTTSATLTVNDGTFDTANFPVSSTTFVANSGRATTLNLGTSVITLNVPTGTPVSLNQAMTTLNASTATFVIGVASASTRTLTWGTSRTVGTITYTVAGSTGTLVLVATTGLTIGTLNFSDASNARTLNFTAGITYTITTAWNVNGTAGKLMTVDSATAATHTLAKAGGTVSSDYLSVKNSLAGGGAAWYAGANSTDAGGNTGWIFTAPPATSSAKFLAMF